MDNLTHSLVGVLLSRAGLNRLAPQAGWLLLASANAPDLDVFSGLKDATAYLDFHRGLTHSLPMAPLLALLPWAVWRLAVRRGSALGGYVCALAGVLSHLLLDAMNAYGIRLLLPFRSDWYSLDAAFIIDIWIWALLLAAVIAPLLARLVNAEIGARSGPGRGGASFALLLMAAFLFVRSLAHSHAIQLLLDREYPEGRVLRVGAFPGPANPLRWRGVVELPSAVRTYDLDLLREFDPDAGRIFYKSVPADAIAAARRSPVIETVARFNQFPYWSAIPVSDPENGLEVRLDDLRFGEPGEGRFSARALLDARRQVVQATFGFGTLGVRKP